MTESYGKFQIFSNGSFVLSETKQDSNFPSVFLNYEIKPKISQYKKRGGLKDFRNVPQQLEKLDH